MYGRHLRTLNSANFKENLSELDALRDAARYLKTAFTLEKEKTQLLLDVTHVMIAFAEAILETWEELKHAPS
jgi:hypothetical protein